jgi:hypothetical protein
MNTKNLYAMLIVLSTVSCSLAAADADDNELWGAASVCYGGGNRTAVAATSEEDARKTKSAPVSPTIEQQPGGELYPHTALDQLEDAMTGSVDNGAQAFAKDADPSFSGACWGAAKTELGQLWDGAPDTSEVMQATGNALYKATIALEDATRRQSGRDAFEQLKIDEVFMAELEAARRIAAAVKIQSRWRGYRVRRSLADAYAEEA